VLIEASALDVVILARGQHQVLAFAPEIKIGSGSKMDPLLQLEETCLQGNFRLGVKRAVGKADLTFVVLDHKETSLFVVPREVPGCARSAGENGFADFAVGAFDRTADDWLRLGRCGEIANVDEAVLVPVFKHGKADVFL
jgi:hypothetical protein